MSSNGLLGLLHLGSSCSPLVYFESFHTLILLGNMAFIFFGFCLLTLPWIVEGGKL